MANDDDNKDKRAPQQPAEPRDFREEELEDYAFWIANKAAIEQAQRDGRIIRRKRHD